MKLTRSSLLVIGALTPSLAFGLGIRISDQDPFATARGNAFAATADNPSAVYYNPAGITQLEGHNFRLGVYTIALESQYSGQGVSFDTKDDLQAVPQAYYTFTPQDLPVSAGLGFYSPYGLSLEWPDASPFRTHATKGEIVYLTLNPVVAVKLCDKLSVAAGATLNHGDADLRRGIFSGNFGDEFKFSGDDTDLGFNFGILWQPHTKHSFGFNYRSQTTMDFDGTSRTRGGDPFVPSGSQPASARFTFPQNVVVGYSFRPTEAWNFEVNVDWTDWDRLDTVTLKQASGNLALPFNWESSFFYEFGATRYFEKGWRASAGYIYSENSVPAGNFNPIVPDSERHIFSAGVGRSYERWNWDAGYQFAWGPERTVSGSALSAFGESADGRYEFFSHAFTFSIGYRF